MTIFFVDFPSGGRGRYGLDGGFGSGFVSQFYGVGMFLSDDPRPGPDGQGVVWSTGQATNTYLYKSLPDVNTRFVFSCRVFMYSLPPTFAQSTRFRLWEDQDDVAFDIQIKCDGSLGTGFFVPGSWQLLEVMMGAGAAHDHLIVRIDGEEVINSPGGAIHRPELPLTPIYSFQLLNSGAPNFMALKDLVLQYGPAATFIGQGNVKQLVPTSAVSSGWTLTGGATDFGLLDNSPPVFTQYISAPDAAIGHPSVTGLSGLRPHTKTIFGLWPCYFSTTPDAGTVQGSLVAAATPRAGTPFAPDGTGRYYQDTFLVDPATGVAWDPATVAALQLSINRTV